MQKKLLEVGNVVYTITGFGNHIRKYKIERVTDKTAFYSQGSCKRELNGHLHSGGEFNSKIIGSDEYLFLENGDLKYRFLKQTVKIKLRQNLNSIQVNDLTFDEMIELNAALEKLIEAHLRTA